jgi:hypothetical protein
MSKKIKSLYEFDPFRLDIQKRLFFKGDTPVSLTPKAFEMLAVLVKRSGHLVEKEEPLNRLSTILIVLAMLLPIAMPIHSSERGVTAQARERQACLLQPLNQS